MYILEYYKQLREDSIKVQNDAFTLYQDVYMIPTLHTFRVFQDNTVTLENETEEHSLMDFAVYGHRAGSETAIERYLREQHTQLTPRMLEFAKVSVKNQASFFGIENVDKEEGTINVICLIGKEKGKKFCISDWGFSQTANTEMLIFTRFIPFPESFEEREVYGNIGMTSGMSYIFYAKDKDEILKEADQLTQEFKIADAEISKQVVYFHLNRKFGAKKELI